VTGEFTRNPEFRIPGESLAVSLQARLRDRLALFDATELARVVLGDSIYSNMMVLGGAWQAGLVPLSHDALMQAIALNGQAVDMNKRAFELGRWALLHAGEAEALIAPKVVGKPKSLDEKIAYRAAHLTEYQNAALARRYRALVDRVSDPALREAVALGYHKLLSYKDEYEVARLIRDTRAKAEAEFEGDLRFTYHMAPPIFEKIGTDGRPVKRNFGPWLAPAMQVLARFKGLRGTALDPFGHSAERRMERALIVQYEADMEEILAGLSPARLGIAVKLAELPLSIRGYGPVKAANAEAAARTREALLAEWRAPGPAMAAE